ncbi:MAG: 4Fe-4S binding protein [Spirochaetales bacterium]|nr:4Fe-4S binding protein [Spirochaetales bacterium]
MKQRYFKNVVTLQYNKDNCTGCGMCVEVCPRGVFAMNGKKAIINDRNACIECGACMKNCAFNAISVRPGVGCAYAIIMGRLKGTEPGCGCGDSSSACCG